MRVNKLNGWEEIAGNIATAIIGTGGSVATAIINKDVAKAQLESQRLIEERKNQLLERQYALTQLENQLSQQQNVLQKVASGNLINPTLKPVYDSTGQIIGTQQDYSKYIPYALGGLVLIMVLK